MRKVLALMMAAGMCAALSGCQTETEVSSPAPENSGSAESSEATTLVSLNVPNMT